MRPILRWTLVFVPSSEEHLAERGIDPEDVAAAVFGLYGSVRLRRGGRGENTRWFVVAPLEGGEFMTCVLRAAHPRDLETAGAFAIPASGVAGELPKFSESMRLCVSARISAEDEIRSYRAWRRAKGER